MQLKKLTTDNYVVVTDELIQPGDYYINTEAPQENKIYKGLPVTLENGYKGRGYKDRNYFKNYMRKITHSTNINFSEVCYIPLKEIISLVGENPPNDTWDVEFLHFTNDSKLLLK